MKILKYKKLSGGKYKVTTESMELVLYEEVILKYELLLKKDIDPLDIQNISNDNMFYKVYYCGLNSIKSRFKSVYDLKTLLLKKEFPQDIVDNVINKLLSQGYLNDQSFAKAFINNQIVTTSNGPYKIRKLLNDHKIASNIIDTELEVFTDDIELEKIEKLTKRFYTSNKTRGGFVLRKKITTDLINYGYDSNLIDKVLSNYDFSNNPELAKKEYDKLYRKLSRKYSGDELNLKIREKMYMKGLKYEED